MLGMYLVNEAATDGYQIVGIEEGAKSGPEHDPRIYPLVMCEKVEPGDIPKGKLEGWISWDKR